MIRRKLILIKPFHSGGPRDPLKKRYSLSDSIMHLIEDHGEMVKYLRNKSENWSERYSPEPALLMPSVARFITRHINIYTVIRTYFSNHFRVGGGRA